LPNQLEGVGYFIFETFSRICRDHPEHEFIFIFDRPYDKRFIFSKNITAVVTGPPARHPLLWKIWYDLKLPGLLKKYRADVFVSPDGYCSLRTKIPQCMVLHDLAFVHYPQHLKWSHAFYYKRYMGKFLKKATRVATVSEFSKEDILKHFPVNPAKIDVVYSAAKKIFVPINEEEKDKIKTRFTGGKEFFIYVGAIHPRKNLVNLLKAFSLFKKRQKSNLKLVIAGRIAWKSENFVASLRTYKYREDVVLTGYLDEKDLASLVASSYGLIYPSLFEGFGVPVLEAMHAAVPVVTSAASSMEEIAGDAALYADPVVPVDIADKMMMLYKDERLKNELVQKGFLRASSFSWERTAELLWRSILDSAG
jgi:glycosyltransferase involved in cell wall biosynthesis